MAEQIDQDLLEGPLPIAELHVPRGGAGIELRVGQLPYTAELGAG